MNIFPKLPNFLKIEYIGSGENYVSSLFSVHFSTFVPISFPFCLFISKNSRSEFQARVHILRARIILWTMFFPQFFNIPIYPWPCPPPLMALPISGSSPLIVYPPLLSQCFSSLTAPPLLWLLLSLMAPPLLWLLLIFSLAPVLLPPPLMTYPPFFSDTSSRLWLPFLSSLVPPPLSLILLAPPLLSGSSSQGIY